MSNIEIGIYYYEDEDGNKVYDYEEMQLMNLKINLVR